jgi:hypothetical protein
MPRRVPELHKVRQAIGFRPTHALDDIIAAVIEHVRGGISDASAAKV